MVKREKDVERCKTADLKNNISYYSLLGDFIGTLEGILFWEIEYELEVKLKNKIDDLKKLGSKITDDSRS